MLRSSCALALVVAAILPTYATQEPARQVGQDPFAVATLCIPYPQNTRPPILVHNGAELQNALDDAKAGDTIELAVGAIFRPTASDSSFVLRNRSTSAGS